MAEPQSKSGLLEIHIVYAFDRLRESKLAQAYMLDSIADLVSRKGFDMPIFSLCGRKKLGW